MPTIDALSPDQPIHWVVFDAAGTLIHLPNGAAEVYASVGREFGLDVCADYIESRFVSAYSAGFDDGLQPTSEADQRQRWQAVVEHCFAEIHNGPENAPQIFHRLWTRFAQLSTWQIDSDTESVFRELQKRQIGIAIASNFDSRLKSIVRESSILSLSQKLFLSSEIGFNKPHTNFYRHVFSDLKTSSEISLEPNNVLMVGDSLINDVRGAIDAGWHAVHYCGNHPISGRPMVDDDAKTDCPKISKLIEITD